MTAYLTDPEPWGGAWPADGSPIDVPTPAPGPHWRVLRNLLEELGFSTDPNLHPTHGLVGYGLRARNANVSVGLVQRVHGVSLVVTAVLCRGMERERAALAAADVGNRALRLGQILFYPGPPPELSFYATQPWDLLAAGGKTALGAYLAAVLAEMEEGGFAAVSAVRGYHPADLTQLWRQLAEMAEQEAKDQAESSTSNASTGQQATEGAAVDRDAHTDERPRSVRKRKRKPHGESGENP